MIIYHAITTFHILKLLVHKLIYHKDEDAVLLVPSFLRRKCTGLLKEDSVFKKTIFFEWDNKFLPTDTEDTICKRVEKKLSEELYPLSLYKDIQEVNICSAAYSFGIFICKKGINFNWFEEADGRLSEPEPIMRNDAQIVPLRYQLACKYGLYTASNPLINTIYANLNRQIPGFDGTSVTHFDLMSKMRCLGTNEKEILLDFFDVPRDEIFNSNSVLLLTQHFHGLRMLTWEEHILLYQLTCDFYLNGYNIYCKWHPSDLMPYERFIKIEGKVSGVYPSELIPLVNDTKFAIGAAISTTGIGNLSSMLERVLLFDEDYLKTFLDNIHYYNFLKIAESFPKKTIYAIGVNQKQLINLRDFSKDIKIDNQIVFVQSLNDLPQDRKAGLFLIANQPDENVQSAVNLLLNESYLEDMFFFIDKRNNYFYSYMKYYPFIVKDVKLTAIDKNIIDKSAYRLFVFSKNKNDLRRVSMIKYEKELINTGIKIEALDNSKEMEINILKGMLKVTEEQLLKYVEENKQLKLQLQDKK